jgi:hypothetical protein
MNAILKSISSLLTAAADKAAWQLSAQFPVSYISENKLVNFSRSLGIYFSGTPYVLDVDLGFV